MTTSRPPFQLSLDLQAPADGEAVARARQKVEAVPATDGPNYPVSTESLMEAICDRHNVAAAVEAVVQNKGAAGVDGMTVKQLPRALAARWSDIEAQLLQGRYQPQPVRRVRIPKPDGGERLLGIPTVIDRMIQQAVLQRLQPLWDPTFSEHSYGFRPGRSAHQAVAQAQAHIIEGYRWVVDIDLAKFFDRVNHDRLMAAVAARVADRRVLRLLRSYLTAGVLEHGLFEASREGTPQGGPARHGECDALHRTSAQAAGECGQECCRAPVGPLVPRLFREVRVWPAAVHRPEGARAVQTPRAAHYGSTPRRQPEAVGPGPVPLSARVGRILRVQPTVGTAHA